MILGPLGVTLVLSLKGLSFAYLAIAPVWNGIAGELEEAARVHGIRPARSTRLTAGLLLFDEPLSNLDAQLREELRLEIAQLTREYGITTLYITHDQAEAFFLADRLGVMRGRALLQFDRPERVFEAPADLFVARFTGAVGEFEGELDGSYMTFRHSPGTRLRLVPLSRARARSRPGPPTARTAAEVISVGSRFPGSGSCPAIMSGWGRARRFV